MTTKTEQVPGTAFVFESIGSNSFDEGDDNVVPMSGTAYNGGVIVDHPYWDRVAFDISDIQSANSVPLLKDHYLDSPIGMVNKFVLGEKIDYESSVYVDEPEGAKVVKFGKRNFPWQVSLRILPKEIFFLGEGESTKLNGQDVEGPLHIFKKSSIRELSVTTLGADHETSARFSAEQIDVNIEDNDMSKKTDPKDGANAPKGEPDDSAEFSAGNDGGAEGNGDTITLTKDQFTALNTQAAAGQKAIERLDALESRFEAQAKSAREKDARELCEFMGIEPNEENLKLYTDMDEATFTAVATSVKSSKTIGRLPDSFTTETLGDEHGGNRRTKFESVSRDEEDSLLDSFGTVKEA